MQQEEPATIEDLGWKDGTAAEFLELTPEESALIERRLVTASGSEIEQHAARAKLTGERREVNHIPAEHRRESDTQS